jgi:hypothetical protein
MRLMLLQVIRLIVLPLFLLPIALLAQDGLMGGPQGLYQSVLALVFPTAGTSSGRAFSLRVLLRENNAPESFIEVIGYRDSTAAVEYSSADTNVDALVNSVAGSEKAEAIAQRVHVLRKTFRIKADRAMGWQRSFVSALAEAEHDLQDRSQAFYRSGEIEVALDGDSFEIRYQQGMTSISIDFSDPEASSLKTWVLKLRDEIKAIG